MGQIEPIPGARGSCCPVTGQHRLGRSPQRTGQRPTWAVRAADWAIWVVFWQDSRSRCARCAVDGRAQVRFHQSSIENVVQAPRRLRALHPGLDRLHREPLANTYFTENFDAIAPGPPRLQRDPPFAVKMSLLEYEATLTNGNQHVDEALRREIAAAQSVTMWNGSEEDVGQNGWAEFPERP